MSERRYRTLITIISDDNDVVLSSASSWRNSQVETVADGYDLLRTTGRVNTCTRDRYSQNQEDMKAWAKDLGITLDPDGRYWASVRDQAGLHEVSFEGLQVLYVLSLRRQLAYLKSGTALLSSSGPEVQG